MNEDAQNALLKTLEEPPPRTTIILCADEEDRLLPTVRSRSVRLRMAPLGIAAIEGLLVERAVADAPTAARLARIVAGRPGLAMAYARLPEAITIHDEIARTLLDLLSIGAAPRLVAGRELIERAAALEAALRPVAAPPTGRRRACPAVRQGGRARLGSDEPGPGLDGAGRGCRRAWRHRQARTRRAAPGGADPARDLARRRPSTWPSPPWAGAARCAIRPCSTSSSRRPAGSIRPRSARSSAGSTTSPSSSRATPGPSWRSTSSVLDWPQGRPPAA